MRADQGDAPVELAVPARGERRGQRRREQVPVRRSPRRRRRSADRYSISAGAAAAAHRAVGLVDQRPQRVDQLVPAGEHGRAGGGQVGVPDVQRAQPGARIAARMPAVFSRALRCLSTRS